MLDVASMWYKNSLRLLSHSLLPFAFIFKVLTSIRRSLYHHHLLPSFHCGVPVIVVGNITIGGTGKTPFVIWLSERLKQQGFSVGIVSRGVGGSKQRAPRLVSKTDLAVNVGDEAKLLAEVTHCPVAISIDRVAAIRLLLAQHQCNIILSDDGLQHYRMRRDIEIIMIDEERQFGNGRLLPAGPLRELPARLKSADFIVRTNAPADRYDGMQLEPHCFKSVKNPSEEKNLQFFVNQRVHAVAGIGHPARFFQSLKPFAGQILEHSFADHYLFQKNDLAFTENLPIVMTAKDAVKCQPFAANNWWYLQVNAKIGQSLEKALLAKINSVCVKYAHPNLLNCSEEERHA